MRAPVEVPLDGYRRGEDLQRKTKFPSTMKTENGIVKFLRERLVIPRPHNVLPEFLTFTGSFICNEKRIP